MSAMKLGATLNGFTIVTPPTNNDAGMSQWCHVERDGERFFMKMYLAPKYPTASSPGTPEGKERRRKECEHFEKRHLTIAHRLKGDAPGGGHLVTTLAFFRVGPAYYKVTRLVDVDHRVNLTEQDPETRAIALRSLLFSVRLMHDQGIVHGDLKPDNVLFQRTSAGAVTSKLIDFDEAYLSGEPPDVMHIVGDPLYYSPEMFGYVKQDGTIGPTDLTLKCDIFSLGVLIHVLLTGDLPYFDRKFGYPCEAAAAGESIVLRETLPVGTVRQMLVSMLATAPADRPDINAVIAAFRADDLRAAAEGAMPELTRAEEIAMRRLRERAAVGSFDSPAGGGTVGGRTVGGRTVGGETVADAEAPRAKVDAPPERTTKLSTDALWATPGPTSSPSAPATASAEGGATATVAKTETTTGAETAATIAVTGSSTDSAAGAPDGETTDDTDESAPSGDSGKAATPTTPAAGRTDPPIERPAKTLAPLAPSASGRGRADDPAAEAPPRSRLKSTFGRPDDDTTDPSSDAPNDTPADAPADDKT